MQMPIKMYLNEIKGIILPNFINRKQGNMIKTILWALIFLLLIQAAIANEWSRLIASANHDDVLINFKQKKMGNAWSVQWQVNNTSDETIEPFLNKRSYTCEDTTSLQLNKVSLGIYAPNSKRYSKIKDTGICPNSKIKLVKIQTEIVKILTHKNDVAISPN
jgi:hypothetical protein